MHCDPSLITLLLVNANFENVERGRFDDRALVYPAHPLACIGFYNNAAMARQQIYPEVKVDRPL